MGSAAGTPCIDRRVDNRHVSHVLSCDDKHVARAPLTSADRRRVHEVIRGDAERGLVEAAGTRGASVHLHRPQDLRQRQYHRREHCRDNASECVDIVLANGSLLGQSHQEWQLNEILGLVFPATNGIGVMNEDLWDQTVTIATGQIAELQGATISRDSFRTDIAQPRRRCTRQRRARRRRLRLPAAGHHPPRGWRIVRLD